MGPSLLNQISDILQGPSWWSRD